MTGWLRSVRSDLLPPPSGLVTPLRLPAGWPAAWLPPVLMVLAASVLGGAGWHVLLTDYGVPNRMAAALGVAQALPLLLALFTPLLAWWLSLAVAIAAALAARSAGSPALWPDPTLLVYLAALAIIGLRVRPRILVELWLLTVAAGAVLTATAPGRVGSPDLLEIAGLAGTVLIASGSLRALVDTRRRLAEQTSISESERHRRALLEERARIARELHDVVAHHMSVIAIQAEAAPYRVADAPPELTGSFAAGPGQRAGGPGRAPPGVGCPPGRRCGRRPRHGAATDARPAQELADNGQAGGLAVTTRVSGEVRPLPRGVELSAYRIVQEALSNAMRHAPGSEVQVDLRYETDAVAVQVTNGPSPTAPADPVPAVVAGTGCSACANGPPCLAAELAVGPAPDGGYAVTAILPTDGRRTP